VPYTTVNFSDVEDFEAIPEGEYAVEIDKVEVRRNKADDGDYLNWEFVVLDGDYENRRLWLITSLKPTALFRLKSVFEQLDVLDSDEMELEYDDDQEVTSSSGPRLLYPDVEGLEATVKVKVDMYDGKERNKVEDLYTGRKKRSKKTTRTAAAESRTQRRRSRARDEEDDYDDDDDDDEEEEESPRRTRSSRNGDRDSDREPRRRERATGPSRRVDRDSDREPERSSSRRSSSSGRRRLR